MLEILLFGGGAGKYFPDSGPGSKRLLAGTQDYGYFGEVTEAQLALNDEFKRLLNETYASVRSVGAVTNTWFKFIVDRRVLFFPKLPLAGKISMADLYVMKAVYDADETYKPATDYTTGQPLYTQNRHISNGLDLFKMRLMDWLPNAAGVTNTTGAKPTPDSELYKLLMALVNTGTQFTDTLHTRVYRPQDFYTLQDGNLYPDSWVKETGVNGATTSTFTYNVNGEMTYWRNTDQAWRPVLEYIPAVERVALLFDLENLGILNEGLPHQVVTSGNIVTDLFSLTNFHSDGISHQVVTSGSVDNPGYGLAPTGGWQTIDNIIPIFGFTTDTAFGLYDTMAVSTDEYYGYEVATVDNGGQLTYTTGTPPSDLNGYMTAS